MSITVIGSLNYDLVTFTNVVPEGGETIQANSFENHLGGKGLNEALASARLLPKSKRSSVRMIGNVGNDSFGKELRSSLIDVGVNVEYVKVIEGKSSGVAVILVEEDSGENRILITPGANGELKPTVEEYETYFPLESTSSSDKHFVVLQNEFPNPIETINWIKTNRPLINIAYNPSPYKHELVSESVFSQIDLLILNEGEARDAAETLNVDFNKDEKDFEAVALKLHGLINQDNVSTVVITLGSKGCLFVSGKDAKECIFVPSVKVDKVVDTTGAGDTFFGGIVLQLSLGANTQEAIEFATIASSITIRSKGAAESIPTLEDVEEFRKH